METRSKKKSGAVAKGGPAVAKGGQANKGGKGVIKYDCGNCGESKSSAEIGVMCASADKHYWCIGCSVHLTENYVLVDPIEQYNCPFCKTLGYDNIGDLNEALFQRMLARKNKHGNNIINLNRQDTFNRASGFK